MPNVAEVYAASVPGLLAEHLLDVLRLNMLWQVPSVLLKFPRNAQYFDGPRKCPSWSCSLVVEPLNGFVGDPKQLRVHDEGEDSLLPMPSRFVQTAVSVDRSSTS